MGPVRKSGTAALVRFADPRSVKAENRHALARGFDVFLEAAEVVVEQLVRELVRDAIQPVRRGLPLVRSENEAVLFLPQVVAGVRIAQQRQFLWAFCQLRD